MKKNVASQVIGAQMITAADGSAFTGSVTVYVTGDGGTQAVGSVGSGACTHEGNGFHSYAPAQAETNYDHVAFTFIGTGAIPATLQIYTSFPQSADAPTAAAIRTEMDSNSTQLAAIVADTNELQVDDVPGLIAALNDPTAATIAAAVWNSVQSSYVTSGTMGRQMQVASTVLSETTLTGTPTTTTMQLTAGSATDEFYTDMQLVFLSGTYAGLSRIITSYTGATKTITLDEALPGAPAASDTVIIRALHNHSKTQIAAAVLAATLTELAADPGTSPATGDALMLLYMALRNARETTATTDVIKNNAGATVLTASLSDDATTFTKGKYA